MVGANHTPAIRLPPPEDIITHDKSHQTTAAPWDELRLIATQWLATLDDPDPATATSAFGALAQLALVDVMENR